MQVHYGRASMTPLSRLPAFFVFPHQPLNVPAAAACLAGCSLLTDDVDSSDSPVLVFLDQPLLHQLEALQAALAAQLEQQGRGSAASQLVFPAVPRQHMEPEQRQQQKQQQGQQQQQRPVGCCGGGVCGQPSPPQMQDKQQQPAAKPSCGSDACPCAAAGSQATNVPQAAAVAATPEAAIAAPAAEAGTTSCGAKQHSLAGYQWQLPAGVQPQACRLVWVGAPDAPALLHLQLTYSASRWAMVDPSLLPPLPPEGAGGGEATPPAGDTAAAALREGLPLEISRALRRRYFLIEKARDASVVGILVGTLGAAGYADAVGRLRRAAAGAGKKSYTLLVGKPSPAKLANFPEIEVGGLGGVDIGWVDGWVAPRRHLGPCLCACGSVLASFYPCAFLLASAACPACPPCLPLLDALPPIPHCRTLPPGVCAGGGPAGPDPGQQGVSGPSHHPP